jgi:hypothetical protein
MRPQSPQAAALIKVLDILVESLASPVITGRAVRERLDSCQRCRNHLLYLLDTEPYTGLAREAITARLRALPETHARHAAEREHPDDTRPQIRGIA